MVEKIVIRLAERPCSCLTMYIQGICVVEEGELTLGVQCSRCGARSVVPLTKASVTIELPAVAPTQQEGRS